METLYSIKKNLCEGISAYPLAIYRVLVEIFYLLELFQLLFFKELLYSPAPFLQNINLIYPTLIILAIGCGLLTMIGLYTRAVAIPNYILTIFLFGQSPGIYHIDYIFLTMHLAFILVPVERVFSVDSLLEARKSDFSWKDRLIPRYYNLFLVFLGVGFVYFDSALWKVNSKVWLSGLGLWHPAITPEATLFNFNLLLNQQWLMHFLSHLTLVFELVFPFLFWFKKIRPFLIPIGVGLHLGIATFFPIPFFGLICAAMYILFLPDPFIKKILELKFFKLFVSSKWIVKLSYQTEGPLPASEFGLGPNILKKLTKGKYFVIFFIVFEIYQSFFTATTAVGLFTGKWASFHRPMVEFGSKYTGVSLHNIFLDHHFVHFEQNIAVDYVSLSGERMRIPLVRENGQAGLWNTGRFWVYWTFYSIGNHVTEKRLKQTLPKWILFWSGKEQIDINQGDFEIMAASVIATHSWQKDRLKDNLEAPWVKVGSVTFRNFTPTFVFDKKFEYHKEIVKE